MKTRSIKNSFIFVGIFLSLAAWQGVVAVGPGDIATFNVEKNFEVLENSSIQAVLVRTAANLNVYIEKKWWDAQVPAKQSEVLTNIDNLSIEFSNNIYPTLTSVFGSEWKPGVDGDNKITLLFHAMKEGAAGYFRSADEYIKLQVPDSNEREMLYLALAHIEDPQLKSILAHEFVHLITFNQKDRLRGVSEEVWLNEARADYAPSVMGYDNPYDGSNLQKRIRDFLHSPSDALTEWQETKYDYASASVFMHYLVDHYGINILADSLKLQSVGISSLNEVLKKNGYQEDFQQIFTDWTIAMVINDCSLDIKYCYLNKHFSTTRINPTLNFLPLSGNSSLSISHVIKNWSGSWQKIIGGNGDLKLDFSSLAGLKFRVPYIAFDKNNNYAVNFLSLDAKQSGTIELAHFGANYNSLVIIPSLQTKITGFDGSEFTYPYTFTISITSDIMQEDAAVIANLLAKIDALKQQIANLQSSKPSNPILVSCASFDDNLYFGMVNHHHVKCLQEFFKLQGSQIYPEGLVTGNFGSLTRSAAKRFQEKYGIPATGFVGVLTRAKINSLLHGA